ncbi:hypothetical protein QM565_04790 [Geitlerinema splendidum]|nr:hypothetical protein [Geitlerinema splendidum]
MKKLICVAMATVMVAGALAQGTFTIRRPADGARVRETVQVRIPKNSIPEGGYIGVVVNGKFLEAVLPDVEGDDYVYRLDTKKRQIADGKMTIETVLYMASEAAPVVLDRSAVTVTLDNSTSIQSPDKGFALRYKFVPGTERSYRMTINSSIAVVTQAQAQLGSRAAEIPQEEETFRYLVAVDNAYNVGGRYEGLVRLQALPEKGKDFAMLTTVDSAEPKKYYDYQMHPVYMRVTDVGREVFSAVPTYFPWEGTVGAEARLDLFALFPLPVLPTKNVQVGDAWQAAILDGELDLTKLHEVDSLVRSLPGRATLEAVEWEMGIPCAKIRSTLALGRNDLQGMRNVAGVQGEARNIQLESVVWIALDRGIIVREEKVVTVEALVEIAAAGGGTGGAPSGAAGGGGGPVGPEDAPGAGGRAGMMGPANPPALDRMIRTAFGQIYKLNQARGAGDDGGEGIPGAAGAAGVGTRGGAGGAGTGAAGVKVIYRVTNRTIRVLEN